MDPAQLGDLKTHYFSIVLMGCGFVSRQMMDIYYSDLEFMMMIRNFVKSKQNCEDIAMNFVMSYFYP